jgi:hypothetical protein
MKRTHMLKVLCSAALCGVAGHAFAAEGLTGKFEDPYYKDFPLFHSYPSAADARYLIDHIGPIGIGIELRQPAFTMHLMTIEKGSPAEATGKLKPGQIIESINGKVLKEIDPRVILGNLITEAEATDGVIKLLVKADAKATAEEVIVKIPVLGPYSDTWPMNCPKSDKIVRTFADFLAKNPRGWGSARFLLSTGEEKDLDVVRGWFSGKLSGSKTGASPWDIGYNGPEVCEYYLRTGDASVLPAIKSMMERLKETIYNGSWMGRGGCNYDYMAGGHMNAAGVHCLTFLLLAKECGVEVDEHTLQSCLYHFYRYAGHWNVSYGDGLPEGGGVDNGKNGGLAFAMAAAATLMPDGEKSVYAKARDISANKSFYTTSWLFHGHTGGGIGELWRGSAAGLLAEKRPEMYRSFMKERRWMYELARRYDGAFGWASGWNVNYGTTGHGGGTAWGNFIPLVYTVPRKQLRIYGAPPTKYSKTYKIPERPWGTAADEVFLSLQAGEHKPGMKLDLSKETLPTHASWPTMRRLGDPKASDAELLMTAYHPDSTSQGSAAGSISGQKRTHLFVELLKSKDPRARLAGIKAVSGEQKGVPATGVNLTDEIITLLGGMISDPQESWWVVMAAMDMISHAPAEKIAPYYGSLEKWLKHEDWWLRQAALKAVTPLATDKAFYQKIMPVVGEMVASNTRAVALGPLGGVVARVQEAGLEVQAVAIDQLATAYTKYPSTFKAPGGQDMSNCADYMLKGIARKLSDIPGGFDKLYEISRKRFPSEILPHKELYMAADASKFGPKVKEALKPIVINYLVPQYVAANSLLKSEATSEPVKGKPSEPKMEGLVDLYDRVGITQYDWRGCGPDLKEITWLYHSYDPAEEKIWEPGWRYRKVSAPKGMENWTAPDFDAKTAGWQTGAAPFGQFGGKLPKEPMSTCKQPYCRCSEPLKTFWDKEVLLLQAKVKFPAFKQGHRYRLVIGGMSHVNAGDGVEIYLNGKQVYQRSEGVGKRAGDRPICLDLDRTLWPIFQKEVVIAAKGFLPIPGGKRSPGVKKQHLSIFLQEMEVPPITDEMINKGKAFQPMLSSAWQTSQNNDDKYLFDGAFVSNTAVLGDWIQVAQVANVDAFKPEAEAAADKNPALQKLTVKPEGKTDQESLVWSGDTLMDLQKLQALKMTIEKVGNQDYLFIESGGFDKKNSTDWKSLYTVMKRK